MAGFLVWNFPPARIFMGDAGSGFLGIMLGVFSLWAGIDAPPVFWSWFILGGCFMVDATITLVRRVRRGERFNEAHRSHAYQYAARRLRLAHARLARVAADHMRCGCCRWPSSSPSAMARRRARASSIAYAPLVWLGVPVQGRRGRTPQNPTRMRMRPQQRAGGWPFGFAQDPHNGLTFQC